MRRRAYHHGDLPAALVDATLELVAEHGVQGFSVAEAARRTGVSISAPYRHFADRQELLAAAAVRGYEELLERFRAAVADQATPADRAAAVSAAYVRFAGQRRPMFELLFGAGLDKAAHPGLLAAATAVLEEVSGIAHELVPGGDEALAEALIQALVSLAQGYATLLLDGAFGEPSQATDLAAERAAAATRALIRGRSLLFEAA
jgi:AcrR family transcriptional regulator